MNLNAQLDVDEGSKRFTCQGHDYRKNVSDNAWQPVTIDEKRRNLLSMRNLA